MTVTHVHKDAARKQMTIIAAFDASLDRTWQLWADPRMLERWWGPPEYPATVVDHDLTPGGSVTYFMTGPEGETHGGWWRIRAIDPPSALEFEDGFADEEGRPNQDMPTTIIRVSLTERTEGGTKMEIETTFPSLEAMQQLIEMGMDEGMGAAMGQIDELLRTHAAP